MLTLLRTNSENPDFRQLVGLLDADLQRTNEENHAFYAQFNDLSNIHHVVVCYLNNTPVGCGAFKPFNESTVELKRMFVNPEHRGHGIGHKILNELEQWATELSFTHTILETGTQRHSAIHLYQKSGYIIIPNFGQYENVATSICMTKKLSDLAKIS